MDKLGYCYDGSSEWSIGPADDPQANPICHVWNRNDEKAKAVCELICNSINQHAALVRALQLAHQCLESLMNGDENDYDAHQKEIEQVLALASPQSKEK